MCDYEFLILERTRTGECSTGAEFGVEALPQREKVESFRLRVFKTKLYATDATVVVLTTYI